MAWCELKVWGVWSIFGHFSPIYPRKIRGIGRRKRRQELVILIFRGLCAPNEPCAPNGSGSQTDSGFQTAPGPPNSPAHESTPSFISSRLNHGRGFGKGTDRLIISLGIKGHMKRKIPNAQVGPT